LERLAGGKRGNNRGSQQIYAADKCSHDRIFFRDNNLIDDYGLRLWEELEEGQHRADTSRQERTNVVCRFSIHLFRTEKGCDSCFQII
jgi:hypothetical protein